MSITSARNALAWAGGVQIFQDAAQFLAMLVLVRLLSPSEYGAMALAQSVLAAFTLFGPAVLVGHALQARNPAEIDWQSHFTASVLMSVILAAALLLFAIFLAPAIWGGDVGTALAILMTTVLIGSPAHVRNTYLHVHHDWARYRLLSLSGTCLGLSVGIGLGFAGFGVVALAVQPALYVLPSAIDQIICGFKPTWKFDRVYYRDAIHFGLNRFAAGTLGAVRNLSEQSLMEANFSLAANGVYGRGMGLSNLLAGRFGSIALSALYPILTRAEHSSAQFRRNSARVLQGVAWTAVPAATFLAIEAEAIVALFYGDGWAQVAHLLPAASTVAAGGAMQLAVVRLLLANESRRAALSIEAGSAIFSIGLALWLLPMGLAGYLWGLAVVAGFSFLFGGFFLIKLGGLDGGGLMSATVPPLIAVIVPAICVLVLRAHFGPLWLPFQILVHSATFGAAYGATMMIFFRRLMLDLIAIFP